MPIRSDFQIVRFWDHLGDDKGDIKGVPSTFHGDETPTYNFYVDAQPLNGYVVMQIYDVHSSGHEIMINDISLPNVDIAPQGAKNSWAVWLDEIPGKYLKCGNNTIQVKRYRNGDNFVIGDVVVHWREYGA